MGKEPDQTRWVGIRPTDPSEDIPVTESAPLTDILVAPSAGDPEFLTLTKKRAPAIGDLQAVKDNYSEPKTEAGKDCVASYVSTASPVPAGEIWVITSIAARNTTSMCDIYITPLINFIYSTIKAGYSIEVSCYFSWSGTLVLCYQDAVAVTYCYGGATDNITFRAVGYKIGVY